VDWAAAVLKEPLRIEKGAAILPTRPGAGIEWNRDAVERYRIT
jgi:mandelate racemase